MSSRRMGEDTRKIVTSLLASLADGLQSSSLSTKSDPVRSEGKPFSALLDGYAPNQRDHIKKVLLTLHFIFPHELLPALDILDRQLVSRLQFRPSYISVQESPVPQDDKHSTADNAVGPSVQFTALDTDDPGDAVADAKQFYSCEAYYVQSASAGVTEHSAPNSTSSKPPGRFHNVFATPGMQYEVHLNSWNCTCPAFALSSLKTILADTEPEVGGRTTAEILGTVAERTEDDADIAATINLSGYPQDFLKPDCSFGGSVTRVYGAAPICKHLLAVVLAKVAPELFESRLMMSIISEIAGRAAGWGER